MLVLIHLINAPDIFAALNILNRSFELIYLLHVLPLPATILVTMFSFVVLCLFIHYTAQSCDHTCYDNLGLIHPMYVPLLRSRLTRLGVPNVLKSQFAPRKSRGKWRL